jgi:hypothetical protein
VHRIVGAILLAGASAAGAQAQEALPPKLSGQWSVMTQRGAIIEFFSLTIDERSTGAVSGKLTWRGINCGAKDEPFSGTWDGAELRFQSTVRPNVNAERANGQCPPQPSHFVLRRKSGSQGFEGETKGLNDVIVKLSASP